MSQRKMLVLGSDYFTLQVVLEAKRQNVYVIVSDLMETSPTKEMADEQWMISTNDIDLLEAKCKEHGVTAVMYGASDFNTGNGRQLCKRLGLPLYCQDDYAWSVSRNKGEFKRVCKSVGAPVSPDYEIAGLDDREAIDRVVYPVVVKPVDKSGNRGVSYCYNKEELLEAYRYAREISDNQQIIVERMLKGTEHNVCYIVADGELKLSSFSELYHHPSQLANIYSFEINASRFLEQYIQEVNESLKKVFQKIGCKEGIVWVDSMRDETDGKFYILEMGYRFPAALASCAMNEKITGIDPVKWMVECALGVHHKKEDMPGELTGPSKKKLALVHLFSTQSGVIHKIKGLDAIAAMDNVFVDMPKREGGTIREATCIGLISIYGEDCREVCRKIQAVNEAIRVEDEQGNNMIILYDDYDTILKNEG